jgi:hypothetical protein
MDPWPEYGVLLRLHGGTGGFATGNSSWLNSVGGPGVVGARLDEPVGNLSSHGTVLTPLTGEDEEAVDVAVEPREDLYVTQQPASSTGTANVRDPCFGVTRIPQESAIDLNVGHGVCAPRRADRSCGPGPIPYPRFSPGAAPGCVRVRCRAMGGLLTSALPSAASRATPSNRHVRTRFPCHRVTRCHHGRITILTPDGPRWPSAFLRWRCQPRLHRGCVNPHGTVASTRSIVATSDDAQSSPEVQRLFREKVPCDGPRQTLARKILSPPRHHRAPPRSKRQRTTIAARGNNMTRIGGRKRSGNPTVEQWVPHQRRHMSLPARRLRVRRVAVATCVPSRRHAPRGTQLPPVLFHVPRRIAPGRT